MHAESVSDGDTGSSPAAGATAETILGGRWALGLGGVLVLLLATVEGAHWRAWMERATFEQVLQVPVPLSSPASHPDVSAPDPGDNP